MRMELEFSVVGRDREGILAAATAVTKQFFGDHEYAITHISLIAGEESLQKMPSHWRGEVTAVSLAGIEESADAWIDKQIKELE